jgi:hypothetical protein
MRLKVHGGTATHGDPPLRHGTDLPPSSEIRACATRSAANAEVCVRVESVCGDVMKRLTVLRCSVRCTTD